MSAGWKASAWEQVFGAASRAPVVLVDGDGPWASFAGALALPVAERAAAGAAVGQALAGRPTLYVLGDAGRSTSLCESLSEAAQICARGWHLPLAVLVDVDAATVGAPACAAALVATGVVVRWSTLGAAPDVVARTWSDGRPTVVLVGGETDGVGAMDERGVAEAALGRPRATALALPTHADVLATRKDVEVIVWRSLSHATDAEHAALSASLRSTGRALVVLSSADRALAPLGIAAVVDAGFWWLEEPPRAVEPGDVDAALAAWT